jgi:hypothetical protein
MPVPARLATALLVTLLLALAGCGSDDESEPAKSLETGASTQSEPGRVAVSAGASRSPGTICKGLSRKKSPKLRKSAFSLCTSSVAKARKTKSATKACKGLSAKKDKTLRSSPKSICKKAAKEALKGAKKDRGSGEAAGDDDATADADADADEGADADEDAEGEFDDEPLDDDGGAADEEDVEP